MMYSVEFENKIIHCFVFITQGVWICAVFYFSMLFCSVEGLGDLADKSPQSCIALINDIMSQFSYLAKV